MRTLALLALSALPLARAAAQDTPELPDKREEIKVLLDELDAHIGERGEEDPQAIAVIDKLLVEFPQSGPKDREAVVDGLDGCFEVKRQESEEGVRDNKLYFAAAVALGEMAPESAPVLMNWIGHKSHRKDVPLQRRLILSLGKTRDEKGRKALYARFLDSQKYSQTDPWAERAAGVQAEEFTPLKAETRPELVS